MISLLREACGLEMVEGVLTVGAESAAGRRCYTNPRRWRFGVAASEFGGGLMLIRLPPDHQLLITINSVVVAALAKETSQSARFCVRAGNPPTNNASPR